MSSPMDELSEHEWREVDVDVTRRVCPYAARPDVGCSIAYVVDAAGRWVKDCGMAGIGSECVWAHPDKELPDLLPHPIEYDYRHRGPDTMNRIEWNELPADDRRAYADPGRRCIERGCTEPAGTPWGKYWCAAHDEERVERIGRQLKALLLPEDPTP